MLCVVSRLQMVAEVAEVSKSLVGSRFFLLLLDCGHAGTLNPKP